MIGSRTGPTALAENSTLAMGTPLTSDFCEPHSMAATSSSRLKPSAFAAAIVHSSTAASSRPVTTNWLRVCVSRRSEGAPCCALDEGRSLGAVLQEEASNRHERLLFNGDGRERHGQKGRLDRFRYG